MHRGRHSVYRDVGVVSTTSSGPDPTVVRPLVLLLPSATEGRTEVSCEVTRKEPLLYRVEWGPCGY